MGVVPVRHTIPAPPALAAIATREWHLPEPVGCTLWRRRLADVYLLRARGDAFVLKLYRAHYRPVEQIEAELQYAKHLFDAGVPVAEPYSGKVVPVEAPEGVRYATLYRSVPGKSLYQAPTEDNARAFGQLAAQVHAAGNDFATEHRPGWDAQVLLTEPLHHLQLFLGEGDLAFVTKAVEALAERLKGLPEGFCHGDIDPGNVHFDEDGTARLFDFDFCGHGPLAYDLAAFHYEAHWAQWDDGMRRAFLEGYGDLDHALIASLAPVRGIWLLGLLACNSDDWGHHEIHDIFAPRHITLLKRLMDETA